MRTRINFVICPIHQLPCRSPRDEGKNCECPRLCRKRMVCLHFTPSPFIATPPPHSHRLLVPLLRPLLFLTRYYFDNKTKVSYKLNEVTEKT